MPRLKEFDVETALQDALDVFWRRGYEATSVGDLVERLGIGKASLYATFGTKHELYLKALDRYIAGTDAKTVEDLSRPGPVLPAIRELVLRFANPREHGCFVTNSAIELPDDPQVARRVASSWDTREVALTMALARARVQGEWSGDPRKAARFLLAVFQGLRVLGKGPSSVERLRDAAEQALEILERSDQKS